MIFLTMATEEAIKRPRNPEKMQFPPAGEYRRLGDGPQQYDRLSELLEAHRQVDTELFQSRLGDVALHQASICLDLAALTQGTPEAAAMLDEAVVQFKTSRTHAATEGIRAQQLYVRSGMFLSFMPYYRAKFVEQRELTPDDNNEVWHSLLDVAFDPNEAASDSPSHRGAASSAARTWHELTLHILNMRYAWRLGSDQPLQYSWSSLQRQYGSQSVGVTSNEPLPYWNIGFSQHGFMDEDFTKVHTIGGRNPITRARIFGEGIICLNMNGQVQRGGCDRMLGKLNAEKTLLEKRDNEPLTGLELCALRNAQVGLDAGGMNLFRSTGWQLDKASYIKYNGAIERGLPVSDILPPRPFLPFEITTQIAQEDVKAILPSPSD